MTDLLRRVLVAVKGVLVHTNTAAALLAAPLLLDLGDLALFRDGEALADKPRVLPAARGADLVGRAPEPPHGELVDAGTVAERVLAAADPARRGEGSGRAS